MESIPLEGERVAKIPLTLEVSPSGTATRVGCALPNTPRPMDGSPKGTAEELVLVQLRYDEYLATCELQSLFEDGELACLGW